MAVCSELFQEDSVVLCAFPLGVYVSSDNTICTYLHLLQNHPCCSSQPLQPWRSPLLQYGPANAGILHL